MSCTIDYVNDWELRHQGAESRLYFGLHSNTRCVIKHRFSKKYRHTALDKKLTKERTKRERRMIERIHARSETLSKYVPKVIWSNEDTLLMTEITGSETLFHFIESNPNNVSSLAPLVGRCVAELHNIGLIHGDLTTSNLMLVDKRSSSTDKVSTKKIKSDDLSIDFIVVPIDFGLSTGSNHPEERAVDLYVLERALLSTHFSNSDFFNQVIEKYIESLDDTTCEAGGKKKILDRLKEVRLRGRKSDYANDEEH